MKDRIILNSYLLNPRHPITVSVVGCGGTGSRVLTELVKVDIALKAKEHPGIYVKAFDHDIVSTENMARQMFYEEDIGSNKANVLITRINQNYGMNWMAVAQRLQESQALASNIVISCLDAVKDRLDLIATLKTSPSYSDPEKIFFMMDFGNGKDYGQIILSYHGFEYDKQEQKMKKELFPDILTHLQGYGMDPEKNKEEDTGPSCSLAIALSRQSLFINSTLAILGMNWLYEMLTKGYTDKSAIYFNMNGPAISCKEIEKPKENVVDVRKVKRPQSKLLV
jgi:PRTRC genetic system ThiF family protein